jgi:type II secretory pathway component GspD/PulD (secretin)
MEAAMKTMTAMAAILAMSMAARADDFRAETVRKLDTMKVSVDFEDVKLPEALDYLRDFTGLNLVVLPKAMEKDADTKIRLKVKDLSVKSVLKLLLASRGLTVTYRGGALVVLPKEDLQDSTTMKLFDVRSLLVKLQDHPGPKVELVQPVVGGHGPIMGGSFLDEPKPPPVDEDFMVQLIRENTGSGSWDSNPKAAISLTNGMLVVNQTPSVLREVEALLGKLGQYR